MADIKVAGVTKMEVTHPDQVKVELARGQKGTYGWTVTAYGANTEQAIRAAVATDAELFKRFGGNGNSITE